MEGEWGGGYGGGVGWRIWRGSGVGDMERGSLMSRCDVIIVYSLPFAVQELCVPAASHQQ